MDHIEDIEQAALFDWARISGIKQLEWMHHIPNGGKRNAREAARLRRQGVKPGICDVFLPYPMPPYHGLYIEMKRPRGRIAITENQQKFIEFAQLQGYKTVICRGFIEAKNAIEEYLKL